MQLLEQPQHTERLQGEPLTHLALTDLHSYRHITRQHVAGTSRVQLRATMACSVIGNHCAMHQNAACALLRTTQQDAPAEQGGGVVYNPRVPNGHSATKTDTQATTTAGFSASIVVGYTRVRQ